MQRGPLAGICQRGGVGDQLQRRHGGVALTDGGHQRQALLVVVIGGPGQAAFGGGQLRAGVIGQPQQPGHGGKGVHPQPPPHIVKIDVAAVLQGGAQVHRAAVAVLQTARLIPRKPAVGAGAVDGGGRVDARREGGRRHRRLEGGAGRVQPPAHPVGEGCGGVTGKGRVILPVGVQVVVRQAHRRQNPAGFHLHRHGGPGPHLPALARRGDGFQLLHPVPECLPQHRLQLRVQIQLQRRPRRGGSLGDGGGAAALGGHGAAAGGAPQQVLIHRLQTALADFRVHGKAVLPAGRPLVRVHRPHQPQQMRGQRTVRPAAPGAGAQPHRTALQ